MRLVRPAFIELRQYVLAPGRRERMIELFDTHFAMAQDELGLPILGQFRVTGDPDRLVWLRGLPDMASRPERLAAFYGGPVWTKFGPEAIGMVTGYDNVQLLHEARTGLGIEVDLDARPSFGQAAASGSLIAATWSLPHRATPEMIDRICTRMAGRILGLYVSDATPNNFPALPIREGEHLLTCLAAGPHAVPPDVGPPSEWLLLEPTARSVMR